jgi:hypothetical protein
MTPTIRATLVLLLFAGAVRAEQPTIATTPKEVLAAYSKNEIAADMRFKGNRAEILGMVVQVGKDAFDQLFVSLGTGEMLRDVRVYFPSDQADELSKLERGDLLVVEAIGTGMIAGSPLFKAEKVAYSATVSGTSQPWVPVLVARSEEICFPTFVRRNVTKDELEKLGRPMTALSSSERETLNAAVEAKVSRVEARLRPTLAKARKDLERIKQEPLPCGQPLVWAAYHCDIDDVRGPECGFSLMRKSVELIEAAAPR